MKSSRNVEVCLTILLIVFVFPKNVSASSSSRFGIYFDPSSVLVTPHPHSCAVTHHPVGYSTQLHPVDGELQHTDGELQHTGWGVTAHRMGQNKCRKMEKHFWAIFFSETVEQNISLAKLLIE